MATANNSTHGQVSSEDYGTPVGQNLRAKVEGDIVSLAFNQKRSIGTTQKGFNKISTSGRPILIPGTNIMFTFTAWEVETDSKSGNDW